ncbi:MAG: L-fucose/L-arabinose isomerase family protein [Chthonomonadales bacterium]|nr:L-fucose/L-arabinose isomerase family protein [Chthonomonadales bacterium]
MHRKRSVVPARIGVFGIGLAAYWPQFEGLRARLEGYQAEVEERVRGFGGAVVSAGLVDAPERAREAGDALAGACVDLVFCYVGTYATSAQVLPVVQRAKAPVVVLNLQPAAALDYPRTDTREWLANCCACCVPEIACAFARSGIPFRSVTGLLRPADGPAGERAWSEIGDWVRAASAARSMREARIGFLGHTYPGMLDMYSDLTHPHAQLGVHVEVLEMCDLVRRCEEATPEELEAKRREVMEGFEMADPSVDPIAAPVESADLDWSCRVAAGLERLVDDHALDGLAYYYRGLDNLYERVSAGMIVGLSLLTGRGVPCSGEGDLKNCLAMFMMDRLGAGGSYTEFYAMDFVEDFLLMGHDGPGHLAISERKPTLRKLRLYHGKAGFGVSPEFAVRTGPVTIVGVTQTVDGRLKLLAAEGESLPGPIMNIGNTNSRLRFALGPAEFMDAWCAQGPTHHVALGVGHRAATIRKLADLLGLELAVVGAR